MGIWPWQVPVLWDSEADRWLITAKGDMGSRKTAFSPTEELLCAQDVSPVGKDPEGFLHAQRPHLDKPLPSVTLGHNQASNDRGTHQPGGASWTPGLCQSLSSGHGGVLWVSLLFLSCFLYSNSGNKARV